MSFIVFKLWVRDCLNFGCILLVGRVLSKYLVVIWILVGRFFLKVLFMIVFDLLWLYMGVKLRSVIFWLMVSLIVVVVFLWFVLF